MADKNTIGWKLQAVRESRGLSVEQLADRADLKAVVIGQIESGALIPSLGPLIRIARALGVRLGTFLDDQENVGPVVVRSGEKRKVNVRVGQEAPGVERSGLLFSGGQQGGSPHGALPDRHLSLLGPRGDAVGPEGERIFFYVFSGEVEITYGDRDLPACHRRLDLLRQHRCPQRT